jgi:hypothetical protein
VVRNEDILPGFATIIESVGGGAVTPQDGGVFLGQYVERRHFVPNFGLEHIDAIYCFGHEVGLIIMQDHALFM